MKEKLTYYFNSVKKLKWAHFVQIVLKNRLNPII